MLSTFFFPAGLNPVLDGGAGDEDPVVAPQVPGGGLVGQTVLDHHADSQVLDAARVLAFGPSQVGQVSREVVVAVAAVMFGEGNQEVDGATGAWVAQVVQGTGIDGVASSTVTTARAATGWVVAAAVFDAWLGKILDGGNTLGNIGDIFAWSEHGCTL